MLLLQSLKCSLKIRPFFAVIGHYNSDATKDAGKIYNENKIVAISPTSTAIRNPKIDSDAVQTDAFNLGEYIFSSISQRSV